MMNQGNFKIQITNPCANDWHAMHPNAEGRFCDACAKNVIDFSAKSDAEIRAFLLKNKDQDICGRFQKQQVDRIRIDIDPNVLQAGIPFWQKFLVIVLVSFGQDFLGIDFCLAQTVPDSTTVQITQTDSTVVEVAQPDSTADSLQQLVIIPPFTWETGPWEYENRLSGPVSMIQINIWPVVTTISGFVNIVEDEDTVVAAADISLIDTLLTDTVLVTGILPVNGFTSSHPKSQEPKNTSERPPQFMIAEEKRRRRRKPKAGMKKTD